METARALLANDLQISAHVSSLSRIFLQVSEICPRIFKIEDLGPMGASHLLIRESAIKIIT